MQVERRDAIANWHLADVVIIDSNRTAQLMQGMVFIDLFCQLIFAHEKG